MNLLFAKQIRSRLTVWYIAVLAMILAVYIVLVFAFQYKFVSNQIYHDEVQDVETVEGLLYFDQSGTLKLRQNYFSHPKSHLLIDRLMEVRDLSGVVLYRTPTLNGAPLGGASLPDEGNEGFNRRIIKMPDGTHVFLISHLHTMQGRVLLIRLGYSLAPFHERMAQFFEILLIALPVVLVFAGFAGYQIAKRALEPLEEMAQKAQRITAQNLHDRLDIENPDDELGHMAVVFNDLLNRLERAFQQLSSFTADAAHELRAPMAAMRALGEVALRHQNGTDNDKEVIASILEETSRLEETINGLLLLAKAEAAQAVGPNTFSLVEVINEVSTLLEVLAEEHGTQLIMQVDTSDAFSVTGDRSLIRSAIMNVVHNAIKFSPADSIVTVTYSINQSQSTFVEMTVTDQGPGIESSEGELVFDRFYTSTRRETLPNKGTGLGLSIAKLVIERSGGEIYFDHTVSVGTRCILKLPAHPILRSESI
ncbi:HAMP domain-containing protein [Granulicella sp. 5B5]|uniref:ATP-binding protein n=1 Tax=Granulicella sp. 5B5 TaxID=1617967 RepID=UPI0015F3DC96|nr:ATP-binding protein [Granulicella sp. 5B5]QMV18437.1 HAMP domain-containing protein [Granulicella sp. 5B5]